MVERVGWLLDVYEDIRVGAVVWLAGEDGHRYRLTQDFPTTFYVAGDRERLQRVRGLLETQAKRLGLKPPPLLSNETRRDLFKGELPALAIRVSNPVRQKRLFYSLKRRFKRLRYYDANIPFAIRYCAARGVFPMARCRVVTDELDQIQRIEALDNPWDLEYDIPQIRTMNLILNSEPYHQLPTLLTVYLGEDVTEREPVQLRLEDKPGCIARLAALLDDYDPDLLVAPWGDDWLLPMLSVWARDFGQNLNLSRDRGRTVLTKKEVSYFSYGQVHYRAQQTYLYGRWHIDPHNSYMWESCGIQGIVEMARVTGVAVQTAARNSPGSGFTAMQIQAALRKEVMVPLHKRQTERLKSAAHLLVTDKGGLTFRPIVGLHRDVAEIDFFSMYASIMVDWNISGETVGVLGDKVRYVPESGVPITQDVPGLVAEVLRPLLAKRLGVKRHRAALERKDNLYLILEEISEALRAIGFVSFGYQGYKNNLFGNIEAHEAITAIGREMLLRAKDAAHTLGFRALGGNTDSLFVQKIGLTHPEDFQPLLDEIYRRTNLVIEVEGVFQWLAFLPALHNPKVGVTNRYFGKFYDGRIKVRGLAQRRSDTCALITAVEQEVLDILALEPDTDRLASHIPEAIAACRRHLMQLREGNVALADLVMSRRLTKEIGEYRASSEAARTARQLSGSQKEVRVGQRMRYIYTRGKRPGVYAWDSPRPLDPKLVNFEYYRELMLRSVYQVLQPLGLSKETLTQMVVDNAFQLNF